MLASRAGSRQWWSLHPAWHPPPCILPPSGPPVSPSPAQENAFISFYSCPAIIFSQLKTTLVKSAGSFYCFRRGFPFSPRPGEFLWRLGLHWLRAPSSSAPQGTAPCHAPSIPGTPLPQGGAPREPPPKGGSFRRDSQEHRATLLVHTRAKCSFPSYTSHCWKSKQKEKSGLKCEGELGTWPPLHPQHNARPCHLPESPHRQSHQPRRAQVEELCTNSSSSPRF